LLVQLGPDLETTDDGKIVLNVSIVQGRWKNITHPSAAIPWVTFGLGMCGHTNCSINFSLTLIGRSEALFLEHAPGHVSKHQTV
jgi:hypothetical protein